MFWQSVWNGLLVLTHWEVWALLIFFVASKFLFTYLFGGLSGSGNSSSSIAFRYLSWVVGGILLEGVIISIVVVSLIPIMVGNESPTSVSILFNMSFYIIFVGCVAGIVIMFISLIFGFLDDIHGFSVFIQAYIVFSYFFPSYTNKYYSSVTLEGNYPGFWYTVLFFILGLSAAYLIYILAFSFLDWYWGEDSTSVQNITFETTSHSSEKFVSQMLAAQLFLKMAGFLPLFMYAAYIGLQL